MKITNVLHLLSHLKWIFCIWMVVLMLNIFINKPENTVQMVGRVLFISGLMMGFSSLSDISKLSDKEINDLKNQKIIRGFYVFFLFILIVVGMVSGLFFGFRVIYPDATISLKNDFSKLGYDCLVLMLGLLCLVKQVTDKIAYVRNLHKN